MCGINGIFAYHDAANQVDQAEILRTRDHMAARGPDGKGEWIAADGRLGLGHRRLSIIDLSDAGAQPMTSADGTFVVTFNGEIYNYRELRKGLEGRGRVFRSKSDTEVLLHLYAEKGEAMVHDLRGMFAFGLWDNGRRTLLLARDPYGIKPLYYADDGRTLRFASQVKALIAGGKISRELDPAGHVGFYLFGSVPEPFSIYREIKALPAGSYLFADQRGARAPVSYHSIARSYCDTERESVANESPSALAQRALIDSVRHHLVADVPVGAFLSSGVDSSALVGLMRDAQHAEIQTITITFGEFATGYENEAPLAAEIARLYQTRHTERIVTEAEFRQDLPRILAAMDQPSIDGVNVWFVAKAAHEAGLKVAVSGLGGDELFGGYPSFVDIPRWVRWLAWPSRLPYLGEASRRFFSLGGALRLGASPKVAGMLELGGQFPGAYLLRRGLFMPWELEQVLDPEIVADGLRRLSPLELIGASLDPEPRSSFAKVAVLESTFYMRNQLLRDADWASMAHSLEVRLPLVDATLLHQIARATAGLGLQNGKRLLADSPSVPVPPNVIARAKTGFGTPIGAWLQRNDRLNSWRARPALAASRCHWARRWAYEATASTLCLS
jgi:asparagine synthase (glutamine-hydrolysing)